MYINKTLTQTQNHNTTFNNTTATAAINIFNNQSYTYTM